MSNAWKAKPDGPGLYWWCHGDDYVDVAQVTVLHGRYVYYLTGRDYHEDLEDDGTMWLGPIEKPQPPTVASTPPAVG